MRVEPWPATVKVSAYPRPMRAHGMPLRLRWSSGVLAGAMRSCFCSRRPAAVPMTDWPDAAAHHVLAESGPSSTAVAHAAETLNPKPCGGYKPLTRITPTWPGPQMQSRSAICSTHDQLLCQGAQLSCRFPWRMRRVCSSPCHTMAACRVWSLGRVPCSALSACSPRALLPLLPHSSSFRPWTSVPWTCLRATAGPPLEITVLPARRP